MATVEGSVIVHTERMPRFLSLQQMQQAMTEAVVKCYRRSQLAEERGRLFLTKQRPLGGDELEIGLFRTNDEVQIGAFQLFYADGIRELNDDEILELFKAS